MPTKSGLGFLTVGVFQVSASLLFDSADTTGVETAAFKDQSEEEIDRLMHMIVVGGGPTGVEYAGELHDFLIVSAQGFWVSRSGADTLSRTISKSGTQKLPAVSGSP